MDQEHYEDADYEGQELGEEGEEIEIEAIGIDVSSQPIELRSEERRVGKEC